MKLNRVFGILLVLCLLLTSLTTVAVAILAATTLAAPAHAAADAGSIAGRLTTAGGAPVADARVEIYNEATNYNGITYTAADGSKKAIQIDCGMKFSD